jgi:tRNA(Ile)-lysidine synthase
MDAVLLRQIDETVRAHRMVKSGERVAVAVSGGADSVCLLHALARLAGRMGISLHVLHLNHGLRGAESDEDMQFVRTLAAGLGLPCEVGRARLGGGPGNLEEEARRARLEFFSDARRRLELDRVATGHTADDQAETVLFRLLRGSGPGGLAGILPVTAEGLIRPLLEVRRRDIEAWLRGQGLSWREDSSNGSAEFTRNRIRHSLLPGLAAAVHPNAAGALARLAGLAREEEEYWQGVVEQAFESLEAGRPPLVLAAAAFAGRHPALARRLLRRVCLHVRGDLRGLTSEHVEAALRLAGQADGWGGVDMPGVRVERSFGLLRFSAPDGERAGDWSVSIGGPGVYRGAAVCVEVTEHQPFSESAPPPRGADCLYNGASACLDGERVPFPLLLRNWRAGDAYQVEKAGRPRRLKEMFQESRIPSWDRLHWPILVAGDQIVWSRRFGPAAGVEAGPQTRRRVLVRELDEVNGR